uniref:branched-chain amino acid ABC transporter permease n=1 Tax=Bordetella sputigena TaxID=1416810 RepID=UPI0039F012C8
MSQGSLAYPAAGVGGQRSGAASLGDAAASDLRRAAPLAGSGPTASAGGGAVAAAAARGPYAQGATAAGGRRARGLSRPAITHLAVAAALLLYPLAATPFFTFQVGAQSLVLGLIALSLALLAGYGGMVTLSQMTVAGIAGYAVALLGTNADAAHSLGWPWWLAVLAALAIGTLAATLIGVLAVRTEGIYTIMITLAIGVAFFYLVQQNYTVFNGFQGLARILPPPLYGADLRGPAAFYYISLACAALGYAGVAYIVRAPFGIALQGIRDNARRMRALGFDVTAHRIAAHALAGLIASVGGVLLVWYNSQISPGSVNTTSMINILIIAVLGGMRHPAGAFLGALLFVLLQNFAIDLVDRERFNLVIGGVFLLVLMVSPDGLMGLLRRLRGPARPAVQVDSKGASRAPLPSGITTRTRRHT